MKVLSVLAVEQSHLDRLEALHHQLLDLGGRSRGAVVHRGLTELWLDKPVAFKSLTHSLSIATSDPLYACTVGDCLLASFGKACSAKVRPGGMVKASLEMVCSVCF